jgi:hypothetical protein
MAKGRVCSKQNIFKMRHYRSKRFIVSGLGGCAECHLQCTANIRVVAAIGNLETAAGAVLKAADLISDGWTGVHISDDKSKIFWPDRFDQLYPVSNPNA